MKIFHIPCLDDNYTYLIIDEVTKEAAVVDPVEPEKVLKLAKQHDAIVKIVLATHHHCGVREVANFAAYAFAPAILVTPLGALSIIISVVLAHIILKEKLHIFGMHGCVLCVVGSITIVLHAPPEREIESVIDIWSLATEPGFLFYTAIVMTIVFVLIFHNIPEYGQTHIMAYIGVCSLLGSLSVMSAKALGIALKLTLSGMNQLVYPQTWAFTMIVAACVVTQLNYLNKVFILMIKALIWVVYCNVLARICELCFGPL